ncbi:MAG TPA: Wzt carbohydrate-binding domain-containing protein, partial [Bryobacteraceae bacterium]|nr:Wzt carbohydrate-binding domain-containing protein [Bryobacteraceae bacterium]
ALCERCLWLEGGSTRMLGPADDVVGEYLSATLRRERQRDSETRVHSAADAPRRAPEVVTSIRGTHRFGDGDASLTGAELVSASGEAEPVWKPHASVVLRVSFCVNAPLSQPIAGFLVRNQKGETIFGSNSRHENYPMPEMGPGAVHTVDFHWTMPELAPGRYFISVAVSRGTLEQFDVCDYVEDAILIDIPAGNQPARGYLRLPCSSVSVCREER